jgi:hypothetical protein
MMSEQPTDILRQPDYTWGAGSAFRTLLQRVAEIGMLISGRQERDIHLSGSAFAYRSAHSTEPCKTTLLDRY